jgi:hypothetical protein
VDGAEIGRKGAARCASFPVRQRRLRQCAKFLLFQHLFKLFALHVHGLSSFFFSTLLLNRFLERPVVCFPPPVSNPP